MKPAEGAPLLGTPRGPWSLPMAIGALLFSSRPCAAPRVHAKRQARAPHDTARGWPSAPLSEAPAGVALAPPPYSNGDFQRVDPFCLHVPPKTAAFG